MFLKALSYLAPVVGGGLYALGFPNGLIPPLFFYPILGLALLFLSLNLEDKEQGLLRILAVGMGFCLGQNFVGYYWVPQTLQEFGELPFSWSYLLGIAFTLILFPQLPVFILVVGFLKKFKFRPLPWTATSGRRTLSYACLLVALENTLPQQFSTHPGHAWMNMAPYLGLAPIFGVPLYSFFSYYLAISLSFQIRDRSFQYLPLSLFVLFLGLNLLTPLPSPSVDADDAISVRVVQPNIGNFLKLEAESGEETSLEKILDSYRALSLVGEAVDLIIWPETAYPYPIDPRMLRDSNLLGPPLINEIVQETGAYLLTGGYEPKEGAKDEYFMAQYNAAFLFDNMGLVQDTYRKIKLIPFGETLPFGTWNEHFDGWFNISFFAKGEEFTKFYLPKGRSFIASICYEILFPGLIRDHINSFPGRPSFIVNLTNDSWFGDTSEPHQHLFLAKWRAVEFDLPIVRSTNTGLTSILYPDGSESLRIGLGEKASRSYHIPLKESGSTLYQEHGLLMPMALIAILFILCLLLERPPKRPSLDD